MNNSFEQMLCIVQQAQKPHIIIRFVEEELGGKLCMFNHIILPDNRGKVVNLSFMPQWSKHSNDWGTSFMGIEALDMSFDEAILYYSDKVLRSSNAKLELRSC